MCTFIRPLDATRYASVHTHMHRYVHKNWYQPECMVQRSKIKDQDKKDSSDAGELSVSESITSLYLIFSLRSNICTLNVLVSGHVTFVYVYRYILPMQYWFYTIHAIIAHISTCIVCMSGVRVNHFSLNMMIESVALLITFDHSRSNQYNQWISISKWLLWSSNVVCDFLVFWRACYCK